MLSGRSRLLLGLTLLAVAVAGGVALRAALRGRAPQAPAAAAPPAAPEPGLPTALSEEPAALPPGDELARADAESEPFEETWSHVDLEAVRSELPDNTYWQRSAPTQDPRVLREREEERERRNELYGKVLSGTGSEDDVRRYYADRQRFSTDAIQLVDTLLEHHAEGLTERDQQFLGIARRLHLARLQEIPRRLEEGLERKRAQDEARAAWLEDEARFRRDAERPGDAAGAPDTAPDDEP